MKPFIVRIIEKDNIIDWKLGKGAVELMHCRFFTLPHDGESFPTLIKAYVEKHGVRIITSVDDREVYPYYFLQESPKGASYLLLQAKEWLDKWKKEADASLEKTTEVPRLPAHQKYYGYTGPLWQDKPVWARRMELLRAECNESCEPFNQRIEVMHQMCIDLAIQAEIDFDAQATGCTLEQLIEHYGHAAGVAIHSMIYTPEED